MGSKFSRNSTTDLKEDTSASENQSEFNFLEHSLY